MTDTQYITGQLENVRHGEPNAKAKVKIINSYGETKWIDIEQYQVDQISLILKQGATS